MAGESGATFIEYAMLTGLVAIVVAIAVAVFGKRIKEIFSGATKQAKSVESGMQKVDIKGDFGKETN